MSQNDGVRVEGKGSWYLLSEDGTVIDSGTFDNLVTAVGGQMYSKRAVGIANPPAAPTGMKLGTGTTAASLTGTGAALVTYLGNSNQALDANYPVSNATSQVTYQCTFPAGKGTSASAITEVVLVNDALGDATSVAANTIARAIISPSVASKAANQVLVVVWNHLFPGA